MSQQFESKEEHDSHVNMRRKNSTLWGVITASSLGTLIEWYDFYIFGSLAAILSTKFFPADNPTAAFLSTLATFDIYRREAEVSRNPLNVGLYILFFPQLIAGPIVRYKDIDRSLRARSISSEQLNEGVRRLILGLAKKMLIANTLGLVADQIFSLPREHVSGSLTWLALLCYTLQIFFDFSGYSDMAIGLAKMMGFEFRENFNFPYAANSIRDFWRRWHISLSTFFRDYVFIPLGGNRKGRVRTYLNLFIIFFLTGLWHGAS